MPAAPPCRHSAARQILALAIGLVSALLAARLHMPLPWMLGAMLGTTVAAMAGAPVRAPATIRPAVIPVIGVLLGSSLRPQVLAAAAGWAPSLIVLPVFLAVAATLGGTLYRRVGGYDPVTAFFAAMPGGLNDMILIGGAMGGDERRIALAHAVRILLAVTMIGLFFGLVLGASSTGSGGRWTALGALTPVEMAWLAAAALVGGILGRITRMPAGGILMPMILSGGLHLTGIVTLPPPSLLVILAQVVMGTTVGARFAGVRLAEIRRDILLGIGSTAIVVTATALFSTLIFWLTGLPLSQAFLGYAPGGLTEMSLIALALGEDVAYVSVLHTTRIVLVIVAAPLIFRLRRR